MPTRLYRLHGGVWAPNNTGSPPSAATGRIHHAMFTAPVAPPPPEDFHWGFQQFTTGSSYMATSQETPAQQYARHQLVYGRDDVQKVFYSGVLPNTWRADREGVNTGTKHVIVCHNTGSPTPTGVNQILAGQYDTLLRSYWRSVPADRTVDLIWNNEMDADLLPSEGGTGSSGQMTKAQYKAAFNHQAQLLHDDQAAGNVAGTVYAMANFMNTAFQQGVWTDDRVPNKADRISFDTYMNPPPPITSNPPVYETTGASTWAGAVALHSAVAARVLDEHGNSYAGRWGWAEAGSPWRVNDVSGQARAACYARMCDALLASDAIFCCLWDSRFGQWDHRIMDYTITPTPSATPIFQQGVWTPYTSGGVTVNKEPTIGVLRQKWGTA